MAAVEGQAQRTLLQLVQAIEAEDSRVNRELVSKTLDFKERMTSYLRRRREEGLPEPELAPHPDDIFVDEIAGRVEFRGPLTNTQKKAFDKILALRDAHRDDFIWLAREARKNPEDEAALIIALQSQRFFDAINENLPERYRQPLKNRLRDPYPKPSERNSAPLNDGDFPVNCS